MYLSGTHLNEVCFCFVFQIPKWRSTLDNYYPPKKLFIAGHIYCPLRIYLLWHFISLRLHSYIYFLTKRPLITKITLQATLDSFSSTRLHEDHVDYLIMPLRRKPLSLYFETNDHLKEELTNTQMVKSHLSRGRYALVFLRADAHVLHFDRDPQLINHAKRMIISYKAN